MAFLSFFYQAAFRGRIYTSSSCDELLLRGFFHHYRHLVVANTTTQQMTFAFITMSLNWFILINIFTYIQMFIYYYTTLLLTTIDVSHQLKNSSQFINFAMCFGLHSGYTAPVTAFRIIR